MVPHLVVPHVTLSFVVWSDAITDRLTEEERSLIKPSWAKKRKADFALGRAAAHEALGFYGHSPVSILKALDDAPIWPSGIVGSIAHSGEYGIAAVSGTAQFLGLGIDLEGISGKPQKVLSRIAHEDEIAWIQKGDELKRSCQLFCAKEALYKALSPLCNRYIGFKEALLMPSKDNQLTVSLSSTLHGDLPGMGEVSVYCADNDSYSLAIASIRRNE